MSRQLKELMTKDYASRLKGVQDALLVKVVGMKANDTVVLRKQLRSKDIRLMVVRSSLAKRATEGTPLGAAFEGAEGTLALLWGGSDIVALAKEVSRLQADKAFPGFEARGGVMDGEPLNADAVQKISKWPSREEQLGILLSQIRGPGGQLAAALLGPGGTLAGQIKQKAEEKN